MELLKKILIGSICFLSGALISFVITMAYQDYWFKRKNDEVEKFRDLFNFATSWLAYKQSGHDLVEKLNEYGYKKVAVYGMGRLGELVLQELQHDGIDVVYGIDKNAGVMYRDLPLYTPDDDFPEADVIIVTAVAAYYEIEKTLKVKTDIQTISLASLV